MSYDSRSGGVSQLYANALFVDAQFGNDATAVKYSMMDSTTNPAANKYKTITAAMNAAVSGEIIIVYPGSYTENTNLFKNGVTYYFYPGATVTSSTSIYMFSPTAAFTNCKVYGKGNFRQNRVSGNVIYSSTFSTTTLYFECNNISSITNPVQHADGRTEIHCNDIQSDANAAINLNTSVGTGSNLIVVADNDIYTDSFSQGNPTLNLNNTNGTSYRGTVYIKARNIMSSKNSANKVLLCTGQNQIQTDETRFEIIAENYVSRFSATTEPLFEVFNTRNIELIVRGNTILPIAQVQPNFNFVSSGIRPIWRSAFAGNIGSKLYYFGNMTCDQNNAVLVSGSDTELHLDGIFISNHVGQPNIN